MRDFIAERMNAEHAYADMEPTGLSVIKARAEALKNAKELEEQDQHASVEALQSALLAGEDMREVNRGSW